jgi:hypothetical protein
MKPVLKSALAVAAMAVLAVVGLPGTASATVHIPNTQIGLAALSGDGGQCIVADAATGSYIDSCGMWGSSNNWAVNSVYPDAPGGAYANVQFKSQRLGSCLTVLNKVGPGGFGNEVSPRACDNGPDQEWASTRSANGHLNYFNFQYRVCLDGGYGDTYGYPENGCNANGENPYEDWYYLPPAV